MEFPWVIVGGSEFEAEEVLHPQTRDMVCPACDKPVRFVEKELVRNLKLFNISVLGLEKGRQCFECPRCRVCIEPAGGFADLATPPDAGVEPVEDASAAAAREKLTRL